MPMVALLGLNAGACRSVPVSGAAHGQHNLNSLLDSWLLQDARYRTDKVSGTMKLTGAPLQDSWLWSPTSLSYNLNATLYEYAFVAMVGDDPQYEKRWVEWDAQRISAHNVLLVPESGLWA
jgi:hypothetical protein